MQTFEVQLDDFETALLAAQNQIPGHTVEDKIAWIVSAELATIAPAEIAEDES